MHWALIQVAGVLNGNNTIQCEEKNNECTVGYNCRSLADCFIP